MYIHRGAFTQRGRGLGSIFSSLIRAVIPVASKVGRAMIKSPITKELLNTVKDTAIQGGVSLAADALRGNNMEDSLQENLNMAKERMAQTIETVGTKKRVNQARPTKRAHTKNKPAKLKTKKKAKLSSRDIFE